MQNKAADEYAFIHSRIKEIKTDEEPKCPKNNGNTLYQCLRSSAKCGPECPYVNDWIGPQKD